MKSAGMTGLHANQNKEKKIMDNSIRDEGYGCWHIQTYQPDGKNNLLGPLVGHLLVDSKLYTVRTSMDGDGVTIIVVPSQNVAYVTNEDPTVKR